jgi:hypothetical protein
VWNDYQSARALGWSYREYTREQTYPYPFSARELLALRMIANHEAMAHVG